MPGVKVGRMTGRLTPQVQQYLVEASQTIRAGDWVVLVDGGSGGNRIKKLTSTEITANYTETNIKGILGIAAADCVTDSNGLAVTQPTPTNSAGNIAGGAFPVYQLPTTSSGIDVDPDTGVSRCPVIVATDDTEFEVYMQAASNAAVTVNQDFIGEKVGLQVYNTNDFAANTGASGAGLCAVVSGVNENDPNFNTSSAVCRALIRILPDYQQYLTGLTWTT